jgi:hypothetical protein
MPLQGPLGITTTQKKKEEKRKTNGPGCELSSIPPLRFICICCMKMFGISFNIYYILQFLILYIYYIIILNILYIYTSLYELIHELSRVEPSLLRLLFELGIGVHEALHLIFESSLCEPSPSLLAKRFAHLTPLLA